MWDATLLHYPHTGEWSRPTAALGHLVLHIVWFTLTGAAEPNSYWAQEELTLHMICCMSSILGLRSINAKGTNVSISPATLSQRPTRSTGSHQEYKDYITDVRFVSKPCPHT